MSQVDILFEKARLICDKCGELGGPVEYMARTGSDSRVEIKGIRAEVEGVLFPEVARGNRGLSSEEAEKLEPLGCESCYRNRTFLIQAIPKNHPIGDGFYL